MCLESVNQITVWRVNLETCVESESMKKKKKNSRENLKILNLTCAWRVTVCRVNPETCVESVSMEKNKTPVKN